MRFVDITVESWKFLGVNTGKGKKLLGRCHSNLYKIRGKIYGDVLKRQWKIKRTAAMLEEKIKEIIKILPTFLLQNSLNKTSTSANQK